MLKPNISQGRWPTKIPSLRCVRRVFVAVTHGGGLSGRPSDLSFRCLSALVRVDFTMSSWVIFNSGCCWMYSRIVSWKIAKKSSVKNYFLLSSKATTHWFLSHLILLLLFQRLGDPFEPLFVRKLRPLFAETIFDVFGGRLGETQKKLKSLKAAKSCILFVAQLNSHQGAAWGRPSFRGCTTTVGASWAFLVHLSLFWPCSPPGLDALPCLGIIKNVLNMYYVF